MVDVAVCSPLARSYLPDPSPHSLRASATVEYIKTNKYRNAIQHLPQRAYFRPMVFNASGLPGPAFYAVLADHLDLPLRAVHSIAGKIGTIIARFNGTMIDSYTKGLSQHFTTNALRTAPPTFDQPNVFSRDGPDGIASRRSWNRTALM